MAEPGFSLCFKCCQKLSGAARTLSNIYSLIVWLIATFFLGSNVEVAFQNVMNVAGFHHKILVGQTAWPRYFSDERPIYFTTSGSSQKSQGSIQKKLEVKFQNVMNVAGFHHKILVGPTAWTRYFSDEQLVYFTTSMSSQKKPGVNAKKWK